MLDFRDKKNKSEKRAYRFNRPARREKKYEIKERRNPLGINKGEMLYARIFPIWGIGFSPIPSARTR
jgi:hypothetical protein